MSSETATPPTPPTILRETTAADPSADVPSTGFLLGPYPVPWRHPIRSFVWTVRAIFGMVSLVLLLAVIAAIPGVNILALGYMLEAEGNVARSGRLRDSIPLFGLAPRLGSIALGVGLWLIPVLVMAGRAADAAIINPGGDGGLQVVTKIIAGLIAVHLCLAIARGGSLGCFFRPLKNVLWLRKELKTGTYWDRANQHVIEFVNELRVPHHFWLGLKGLVGAFLWLVVPTALYGFYSVPERTEGGAIAVTVLGGFLLVLVFAWLPFLQARFAAENRFRAMFELRTVRELFTRAPLAWLIAVLLSFPLALVLYLTKAKLLPADAMWVMTAVFIVTIYPARILVGWTYHRATRKQTRSWWGFRWTFRLLMLPYLGLYTFLIFFSQAIGENGKAALFEHHAFLLPVPF